MSSGSLGHQRKPDDNRTDKEAIHPFRPVPIDIRSQRQCFQTLFVLPQVAPPSVGVPFDGCARFLELARAHDGLDACPVPPADAAQAEEGGAHGRGRGDCQDIDGTHVLH